MKIEDLLSPMIGGLLATGAPAWVSRTHRRPGAAAPAHRDAPGEVVALGRRGLYHIAVRVDEDWAGLQTLLRKYRDRPISLADACLIGCAGHTGEPRILTFDADFDVYRWGRNRRFQRIAA